MPIEDERTIHLTVLHQPGATKFRCDKCGEAILTISARSHLTNATEWRNALPLLAEPITSHACFRTQSEKERLLPGPPQT